MIRLFFVACALWGGIVAAHAEVESNDSVRAALDDIVVLQDENVTPPFVKTERMNDVGRITVNLHADGSVTGEDRGVLENDEAIKGYVERRKDEIVKLGKEPRLFLRGDHESVFRFSRNVIRIGFEVGVDQVIFASFQVGDKDVPDEREEEERAEHKMRETDLAFSLPSNKPPMPPEREIVVRVEKGGRIFLETGEMGLDSDLKDRELPLFRAALKKAKAEGEGLGLKFRIEEDTPQQRVIDVLNACAAEGISIVTFADVE